MMKKIQTCAVSLRPFMSHAFASRARPGRLGKLEQSVSKLVAEVAGMRADVKEVKSAIGAVDNLAKIVDTVVRKDCSFVPEKPFTKGLTIGGSVCGFIGLIVYVNEHVTDEMTSVLRKLDNLQKILKKEEAEEKNRSSQEEKDEHKDIK